MISLLLVIGAVWLLAALLYALGWGRRVTIVRPSSWDLTRNPAFWHELERRARRRHRNDLARGRVRINDAGETASRPSRRAPKDDRRRP